MADLRTHVWASPSVQQRLQAISGREEFISTVVALAASLSLQVSREDVLKEMQEGHLSWLSAPR